MQILKSIRIWIGLKLIFWNVLTMNQGRKFMGLPPLFAEEDDEYLNWDEMEE